MAGLLLGIGLGWLRAEFEALGVPFADRAVRFEESLDILRKCFAGGAFEHHGAVYDFGPVQLAAQPAQVPLILGGTRRPLSAGRHCWPMAGSPRAIRHCPRPSACSMTWRWRRQPPGERCR